jgi:RNA polymerase primary sigma factor
MKNSESYSFLLERIKDLPVVACQDQEFWLSARASCLAAIDEVSDNPTGLGAMKELSPALLVKVLHQCIAQYETLVRSGGLLSEPPSWNSLLTEAIDARERIFQLRLSKLFRSFHLKDEEEEDKRSAMAGAYGIARRLSLFPIQFIYHWRSYLATNGNHPSSNDACLILGEFDRVALLDSIETDAKKAKEILVEGYLRYALRVARGYINMGLEYADLVQEGAIGLIVAADRFEFLEHRRFSVFATTWMWQHITRSLADGGRLIRLPVNAVQKLQELRKELTPYLNETETVPSLSDVLGCKGLSVDECLPLLHAGVRPVRLSSPKPGITRKKLDRLLARNSESILQAETNDLGRVLQDLVKELPAPHRDVISLRFGLGDEEREHTLEEIGQLHNLTRERIRQIEKKAFELISRGWTGRQLFSLYESSRANSAEDNLVRKRPAIRRALGPISCAEALTAYHPFAAEDGDVLDDALNSAFGSRQSTVRQGVTIKGQILAAFAGQTVNMHTAELREHLRVLYPIERHSEATLYSVMAANPDTFVALGHGVFCLASTENRGEGNVQSLERDKVTSNQEQTIEIAIPQSTVVAANGKIIYQSGDILRECEPDSLEFPLNVLQRVIDRMEGFRDRSTWSLAELEWKLEDRRKICQWAQTADVDFALLSRQRVILRGSILTGMEGLGLTFLVLCSEIARMYATEGDMWSHVSASLGSALRDSLFVGPGLPRRQLREVTEEVCRKFKIRHGFGREGEQSWLRTVFLQFGLTKNGYKRLPFWLSENALLPVAVQDLLNEQSRLYSQMFSSMWQTLQRFRWGFCNEFEAHAALEKNPWVYPEDRPAILAASVSRQDAERATSVDTVDEEQPEAQTLLLPPVLRWTGLVPTFEIRLNTIPPSWADASRYVLTIANQRVPVARNGLEWQLEGIHETMRFEPTEATLKADLLQRGVSVLDEPIAVPLTPEPHSFCIYDLLTGRQLDPLKPGRDFSRPTALLCRAGLTVFPQATEFHRGFKDEWIFWAFREGLPAELEIRHVDSIIWAVAQAQAGQDPRCDDVQPDRITLHSPGGWWGQQVKISVDVPSEFEILRMRTGSQIVEFTPNGPGLFRGNLSLIPDQEYSVARIECFHRGRLERQIGQLRIREVNGVAIDSESGWRSLDGSLDVDIEYFRAKRLLVNLPSYWQGEQRQLDDWVLLEGDHFCHRPRRRVSSLGYALYGVGEPLRLSVGPYNHFSVGRQLTKGLLNSGVIRWVRLDDTGWQLHLRAAIDLEPEHTIWIWLHGEDSPQPLGSDQWTQQENICEIRSIPAKYPEGFAISYKGEWLGARMTSAGVSSFKRILRNTVCWPITARWLRWWRAPLLHQDLRVQLKMTVESDPVGTLSAWLMNASPGQEARYSEANEDAWFLVNRVALWNWRPTPDQCRRVLQSMGMLTGDPARDFHDCWSGFEPILAANPILLAQLSIWGVVALYPEATSNETQIFLSILQNLILGLERGAGRQEFKAAFEECRSHAAESLSIDEKFATDELSWLALRLIRGEIINDWNLRVALSNAPIRKFIALSLLQRATELYPLRTHN